MPTLANLASRNHNASCELHFGITNMLFIDGHVGGYIPRDPGAPPVSARTPDCFGALWVNGTGVGRSTFSEIGGARDRVRPIAGNPQRTAVLMRLVGNFTRGEPDRVLGRARHDHCVVDANLSVVEPLSSDN